jgi:lysozyme
LLKFIGCIAFASALAYGVVANGGVDKTVDDVKKIWEPDNKLVIFVKSMENYPLLMGRVTMEEYDDVGHTAKGYGTRSYLITVDTETEASRVMKEMLKEANWFIDRYVKVPLKQHERDALVSLVYNIGPTRFRHSDALKYLNAGDIENFLVQAFDHKRGFVRVRNKIHSGLVARRALESNIFQNGDEMGFYWINLNPSGHLSD